MDNVALGVVSKAILWFGETDNFLRHSPGVSQPHPIAGCVLISPDGHAISETFQRAQV